MKNTAVYVKDYPGCFVKYINIKLIISKSSTVNKM